jgi:hypothetical protein
MKPVYLDKTEKEFLEDILQEYMENIVLQYDGTGHFNPKETIRINYYRALFIQQKLKKDECSTNSYNRA